MSETHAIGDQEYGWSLRLPQFEGPLGLLLHLCQKHELNIIEIPIAFVTEKYLEYLQILQLLQLDVAVEYLVMAATLAHIKSKMLLPASLVEPDTDDDGLEVADVDPRQALIKRLLEYQKYKDAAAQLEARGVTGRDVFLRGAPSERAITTVDQRPLAAVPLLTLVEAFQRTFARSQVFLSHDVIADRINLTDRIHELTVSLAARPRCTLEELLDGLSTTFDLVITFLALLEMTNMRMIQIFQTEPLGPLHIELAIPDGHKQVDDP